MFAKTYGATTLGVDGLIIDVEVDSATGLPSFDIVGLADTAVKESRERVRTAIKKFGDTAAPGKSDDKFSAGGYKKDSSGLDLPIAVGLLTAYGIVQADQADENIFVAELSLEGDCRGVHGVLPMAIKAKERGFKNFFVAADNANEALLVEGINIFALHNLRELVAHLTGEAKLTPLTASDTIEPLAETMLDDFADVQGQFQAKRALEIAAAGGHNVLMVGVPGSGKTMLARRMSTILPELSREEALEVTKIYSIAGLLPHGGGLITKRPFRSPHHTTSMTAMIGGGTIPRPGEVTLAHNGVLFLDELPEFSKKSLEVLREPIEDAKITVSRVNATLTFPSSVILIAAMNPCPCGYQGDADHHCDCTPGEIKRYTRKISGPLLDRIDLQVRVARVKYNDLISKHRAESSAVIRERVVAARKIQRERLAGYGKYCNAQMNHAMLKQECHLTTEAEQLLAQAFKKLMLSARSYDRIIKVGQTIADLAGSKAIDAIHIAEAIQLRSDVGLNIE